VCREVARLALTVGAGAIVAVDVADGVVLDQLCGRIGVLIDMPGPDLTDHCRVSVVEEQRFAAIHLGDVRHLVVGEFEVEDVDVLEHPLRPNGFLDDDDVALDQPAQDDLGD
jgi:hypothetical protein